MNYAQPIIEELLDKAADADKSEDALRYSQAALNAANASFAVNGPSKPSKEKTMPNMTVMRAKMRVSSVDISNPGQEILTFNCVAKSGGYPADGSDEDNTFARWSPSGELKLTVANPNLHGKFKVDDKFYLDFTPAK